MNTFSIWHQYNTSKSVTKPEFSSQDTRIAFAFGGGICGPRGSDRI
jgi:hypothetical protein